MYCKYCGKKLQDGELCDCPQSRAERMAATASDQSVNQDIIQQQDYSVQQDPVQQDTAQRNAAQEESDQNFVYAEDPDIGMNQSPDGQAQTQQSEEQAQQSTYKQQDNNGQQQAYDQTQYDQNAYQQQNSGPQQPGGQFGYTGGPAVQAGIFKDMWEFLKEMFKNPVDAIWHVTKEQDFRYQYIFGGIYLLILLLITWGSLSSLLGGGAAFGAGFAVMAVFALCKLIYTAGVYLYNNKEGGTFSRALAVTCASTIFESTFLLVMGIFALAGSVSMVSFFALLAFLTGVIMEGVALAVVTDKNPNRSFWICILFNVIIMIVLAIIANAIAQSLLSEIISGLNSSLFGTYNYYY
ncbi:MAG: hypothetical protein SOI56_03350 [Eubacteriales bacterium]|jgi:hypothetical protein